jgi:RNA polymerase sigma-70 factor (ECF subfamily)
VSTAPETLGQLLEASARRDRAAFARLYALTSAKLFGVALRILRRQDWAEEVLQECYVRIWEHAHEYREGLAAPMTWMSSIVRNRSFDWLRRPSLETADEAGEILESAEDGNPGPLEQLERSGEAAALAHCLQRLESRQRHAIVLAFHQGLTHSELARHLRQPLGTVKTWVRRGLIALKACLERVPGSAGSG